MLKQHLCFMLRVFASRAGPTKALLLVSCCCCCSSDWGQQLHRQYFWFYFVVVCICISARALCNFYIFIYMPFILVVNAIVGWSTRDLVVVAAAIVVGDH